MSLTIKQLTTTGRAFSSTISIVQRPPQLSGDLPVARNKMLENLEQTKMLARVDGHANVRQMGLTLS
jgi:hypothetical protein